MNTSKVHVPSRKRGVSVDDIMKEQFPIGTEGWICPQCQNHQGGITCSKGIMICWAGANMLGCCCFVRERRKGV